MAKTKKGPKTDEERTQPTEDRGEEAAQPFAGGIFAPEYLDVMSDRSVGYRTELEAQYGGPCEVLKQDDETFAVVVDDRTSRPAAVFRERQWALLAAATLGACKGGPSLALASESTPDGRIPVVVDSCSGGWDANEAGWLPFRETEILRAMHVAETILSSPNRLAHLLEAAGPLVLDGAARILSRRLDLRPSWPKGDAPASASRTVKRYRLQEVRGEEGSAEVLRTRYQRASWLQRTVAQAPAEAGGALYLDDGFVPVGYTCHSAPLEAVDLPPRKIFAPALLSGASYVTVWHKRTFGWPAPSQKDRDWSYYVACCGRHLRITVLESLVLTHDGFVFVE